MKAKADAAGALPHITIERTIQRLKSDDRIKPILNSIADHELHFIAEAFVLTQRPPSQWQEKTQRERELWQSDFEKTVSKLAELMTEGPLPPDEIEPEGYGFPIKDYVLMRLLKRVGYPVPEDMKSDEFRRVMRKANSAADAEDWRILDVLADYRAVARSLSQGKQPLKKPRDKKAARARFLVQLRRHTKLSQARIALVAAVLLDDESIDDSLVRKLTTPR